MIRNLIFTKDSAKLAFTDSGGYLKVIELATNKVISIKAHNGHAIAIAYSPNYQYIATGGQDNVICVWKMKKNSLKKEFEIHGHTDDVTCLVFDCHKHLYSASRDCSIKIWDLDGLY
jgi:WD40 repeat protein